MKQYELSKLDEKSISNDLIQYVNTLHLLEKDDKEFLLKNKEHLGKIMINTFMWRTDAQKRSIISDNYHPTIHSKFHQAVLEQKVQFTEAIRLAKDFELKKIKVEKLLLDLDVLNNKTQALSENSVEFKKMELDRKELEVIIQYEQFELQEMKIAMQYRMKEVKNWQSIEYELLELLKQQGADEKDIWDKEYGEIEDMFFLFLNNLQALPQAQDTAEINNLIALAKFSVQQAKEKGILDKLKARCNIKQLQALDWINKQYNLNY